MLKGAWLMRVLIADDHRLMVEGTKQALQKAGGFEVVGEAVNGVQVLPLVRRLKPELVLLDLRMPQMDGLTCLAKIRKEFPDIKVAILSVSQDPELIQTALKRGACAYIVKSIDPDDLAGALRQAIDGNVFTTAGVTEDPGERAARDAGLTERELVIVRAVARAADDRVATVVEPDPSLAAAVVVGRPDDQRRLPAADANALGAFRLRA